MRALTLTEDGRVQVQEVPPPGAPKPGRVTVDVAFAPVNFSDVLQQRGAVPGSATRVLGLAAVGEISAVGAEVADLVIGDRVAALTLAGGYAAAVDVDARLVVLIPEALPLRAAARAPVSLTTALGVLDNVGRLRAGETVLCLAAAGGLGSVVGHVAKHLGAGRVVGVASTQEKRDMVLSNGYDEAVSYEQLAVDAARIGGVDVIIDSVGLTTDGSLLTLLKPLGRLVVMGNAAQVPDVQLSATALWHTSTGVLGFSLGRLASAAPLTIRLLLQRAVDLLANGTVPASNPAVFDLADAPNSIAALANRTTTGTAVVATRPQR